MVNNNQQTTATCSKKRHRNPDNWKRSVKKFKVNHGEAYVTASGKQVSAIVLKPPCKESCKFRCKLQEII